ncbi:MAG: signal peptidase I [Thermodesulfobacteriota bacterium]
MARIKRRNPWIAALLSLPLPGLGHVYNGNWRRGLLLFVCLHVVLAATAILGIIHTFAGLAFVLILATAGQVFIAADAAVGARRAGEVALRWFQRWFVYAAVLVLFHAALIPVIRWSCPPGLLGVRTFRMPASSMEPALVRGDYFLAEIPLFSRVVPERGDLILFPYPEDTSKTFVKRVISLPGEKLQIKDKTVLINGREIDDPWGVHHDPRTLPSSLNPRDNYGPATIPDGSVFVMGDNRDMSHDSRFFGSVKIEEVFGKALFIYWSKDWDRIGRKIR